MSTKQQSLFPQLAHGRMCSHPSICIPRHHDLTASMVTVENVTDCGAFSAASPDFSHHSAVFCLLHATIFQEVISEEPGKRSFCPSLHHRLIAILLPNSCPPLVFSTPHDLSPCIHPHCCCYTGRKASVVLRVWICRPRGAAK